MVVNDASVVVVIVAVVIEVMLLFLHMLDT